MTLLYYDEKFLAHDTGSHPENATRLAAITDHLAKRWLLARCTRPTWEPAVPELLEKLHERHYIDHLAHFAAQGGGWLNSDTVMSSASYEAATLAAGAACDAVRRVIRGEDRSALCLVRPPGHHALSAEAMGFCFFGNVALAARVALDEFDLDRVLVVDWDVHHGNGTQDMFWDNERVGFLSIHRFPFYPGSGSASETGTGAGLGATVNLPIRFGTSRHDYVSRFGNALEAFASRLRPQLILISAGFDAHTEDPIGSLGLEAEDFAELTRIVQAIADIHTGGKLVSVLEGGYNPRRLAESVGAHLEVLLEHDGPQNANEVQVSSA